MSPEQEDVKIDSYMISAIHSIRFILFHHVAALDVNVVPVHVDKHGSQKSQRRSQCQCCSIHGIIIGFVSGRSLWSFYYCNLYENRGLVNIGSGYKTSDLGNPDFKSHLSLGTYVAFFTALVNILMYS